MTISATAERTLPTTSLSFDGFVCGDEEYGLNEEAHEMASGRKEIDTQTETKDAPEADADKEVK